MEAIITRIRYGWNFTRVLYCVMGLTIGIQAVYAHQWIGLLLGAYFAAMGLFGFGCASGNCYLPPTDTRIPDEDKKDMHRQNI